MHNYVSEPLCQTHLHGKIVDLCNLITNEMEIKHWEIKYLQTEFQLSLDVMLQKSKQTTNIPESYSTYT